MHIDGVNPSPPAALAVRLLAAELPLTIGQEVVAHVVQQLPAGHLLITVQGVPLDAAAPPNLQPGTDVALRVAQIQPQVIFHVIEDASSAATQAAQLVRSNLAQNPPISASLIALRQAVAELLAVGNEQPQTAELAHLQSVLEQLLPQAAPPTADQLAGFVRDGGLMLEAKLASAADKGSAVAGRMIDGDLKGLVLRTINELPAEGAKTAGLTAALAQHLGSIEAQQALNLLAQLYGQPVQLQLPFWAGQNLTTAFLSIEPDDSSGAQTEEQRSGHRVLFLLDLDQLGSTRIDARFGDSSIRVVFYLDGEGSLQQVRSELPAFAQQLRGLGYQEVSLAAQSLADMTAEQRQKVESLALGMPAGVHLVDVRA